MMDLKDLVEIKDGKPLISKILLDPVALKQTNVAMIFIMAQKKFFSDKLCANNHILGVSFSIRHGIPIVIPENGTILGDCNKKKILIIDDFTNPSIIESAKKIRELGGICDKCIVVVADDDIKDFTGNGIEVHSLFKRSEFGLI